MTHLFAFQLRASRLDMNSTHLQHQIEVKRNGADVSIETRPLVERQSEQVQLYTATYEQ